MLASLLLGSMFFLLVVYLFITFIHATRSLIVGESGTLNLIHY
jgi:hypothetical protein